jgi:DNA polymerase-3 subunit epsilon
MPTDPGPPWPQPILAVVDCEATGTDPKTSRIVQVALIIVLPDGSVLEDASVCTLVDPGVPIPPEATAVHGITEEQLRADGAPGPIEALSLVWLCLLSARTRGAVTAAMNARYDLPLLEAEWERHLGLHAPGAWVFHPILDPLVIDRHLDPYRRGRRDLASLCQHYGVEPGKAHDPRADALACAGVLRAIAARYPHVAAMDPLALHAAQADWFARWRDGINRYWARKGDPRRVEGDWPGVEGGSLLAVDGGGPGDL